MSQVASKLPSLFTPFRLRDVVFKNRLVVSPMCQYSAEDGFVNEWHLVHLGSRAVGGYAMVMVEATAVEPEGRISPLDLGLWKDEQVEPLRKLAKFIKDQGEKALIHSLCGELRCHMGQMLSLCKEAAAYELKSNRETFADPFAPRCHSRHSAGSCWPQGKLCASV